VVELTGYQFICRICGDIDHIEAASLVESEEGRFLVCATCFEEYK